MHRPASRSGSSYIKGGDGPMTDWWVYEDLAKPVPKVVACAGYPVDDTPPTRSTTTTCGRAATTPSPGSTDMDINRTERSLCFPFITRFCGQMFLEAKDKELALRCVQAYNDWMIEEWCGAVGRPADPAVPRSRCGIRRPRPTRSGATPPAGAGPSPSPRCRTTSACRRSTTRAGYWDPVFDACDETGTVICMHIGSGSRMAETSPFAPVLPTPP